MVQIRYISGSQDGQNLSVKDLQLKTGVLYWKLNPATYKLDGTLDQIREERGYTFDDEIEISPSMPKYAEKVKAFNTEHTHAEEEVRFVLKGSTNFDVRDVTDDSWIRIEVSAGDLLVLPAGLYHRLALTDRKTVKLLRLFLWKPIWSCYFRPADDLECRKSYLASCDSQNKGTTAPAVVAEAEEIMSLNYN